MADLASARELVEQGRAAYARRAWAESYERLRAAAESAPIEAADQFRLAVAAHVVGMEEESRDRLAACHRSAVEEGDQKLACRAAFWLGTRLMFAGEASQSNGWYARSQRMADALPAECHDRAYPLVKAGMDRLEAGDLGGARELFAEGQATGIAAGDLDLAAISGHGLGRALIRLARPAEAVAVLDEVMVSITAGEVSPLAAGDVYCGVLEACHETSDIQRAGEWTAALSRWCEGQSEQFPYRSQCLGFRAEILQFRGEWEAAMEEVRPACNPGSLATGPEVVSSAFYRLGELHRLRGEWQQAEQAYHRASRLGGSADPGLALLWLRRGQGEAAVKAIRRALAERRESFSRAGLLAAQVEIALATGDVETAAVAADELEAASTEFASKLLEAEARRARAAVYLARGQGEEALRLLREAHALWQQLDAPYEAARTRVLIASAFEQLGDDESADIEREGARAVFEALGARHDLERVGDPRGDGGASGLTARELEVVRLVASGKSNREIAEALVISEHTVARHLQNVFGKLGVTSRTALGAYAFEHRLTRGG